MADLKIAIIVVAVILIAGYGISLLTPASQDAVEIEPKSCEIDSDCVVFGEDGDCNCGCFNKDYKWEKQGDCFCAAPEACKCVDGTCEQVQRFCKDLCGDKVCQEVVCMAIGCPCAETLENCVQDCGNNLDLLQGKWRAVDDSNSVIEFKNKTKIDYYSNEKLFEGSFDIDKDYLVVGSADQAFEYRIIELSDTDLSLMYLPRGNILQYKKILE